MSLPFLNNLAFKSIYSFHNLALWGRGVVVITSAQLHATNSEIRFWAISNPARGVSEIRWK